MDKLNRKRVKLNWQFPKLLNNVFSISYNHENLFKLFESRGGHWDLREQMTNMDESDKVCYEDNIVKDVIKFKG